jgi:hypothetical protein
MFCVTKNMPKQFFKKEKARRSELFKVLYAAL